MGAGVEVGIRPGSPMSACPTPSHLVLCVPDTLLGPHSGFVALLSTPYTHMFFLKDASE